MSHCVAPLLLCALASRLVAQDPINPVALERLDATQRQQFLVSHPPAADQVDQTAARCRVLRADGRADLAVAEAVACLQQAAPASLAGLSPANAAGLVAALRAPHSQRFAASATLADGLDRGCLADRTRVRAAGLDPVLELVAGLGPDLAPERRATWAQQVAAGFAADSDLPDLDPAAALRLTKVLVGLDLATGRSVLVRLYAAQGPARRAQPELSACLAVLALYREPFCSIDRFEMPLPAAELPTVSTPWLVADAAVDGQTLAQVAVALAGVGEPAQALACLDQAVSRMADTGLGATPARAGGLAQALIRLRHHQDASVAEIPDRQVSDLAVGWAADLASADLSGALRRDVAWLFRGSAARQALMEQLVDAHRRPKATAAALLAWSAWYDGHLTEWAGRVDREVNGATGDQRAAWLIAQAQVQELRHTPADDLDERFADTRPHLTPQTIHRYRPLTQALAAAQSAPQVLQVALELARFAVDRHRPGEGASLLASLRGRLGKAELPVLEKVIVGLRTAEEDRLLLEARRSEDQRRVAAAHLPAIRR